MVLVLDMPKKRLQEGFNLHVDVGMHVNYQSKFKTLFELTFTTYKPIYKNNIFMFNDADCILLYQTLYYINSLVLKVNSQEMLDFKESFISKVVNRLSKISPNFNKYAFKRDFNPKILPTAFEIIFPEIVDTGRICEPTSEPETVVEPELLNEQVLQLDSEPVQQLDNEPPIQQEQVVNEPPIQQEQVVNEPVQQVENERDSESKNVPYISKSVQHLDVDKITKTLEMNIKRVLTENVIAIERTLNENVSSVVERVLNENLGSTVERALNENVSSVVERVLNENLGSVVERVLNENLGSIVERALNENLDSVINDKFSKLEEQLISSIIENLEANIVENLEEKFHSIAASTANTESNEILALLYELKEKMKDDDFDDKSKAKLNILEMENSELRRENEEIFEKLNECEKQFNAIKEKYKTLQQIKRKYKTMVLNGANINHIEHIQNDDTARTRKNFVSPIPNEPYREYYKK